MVLQTAILGGLAGADRSAFGQTLLAHPLVVGPLAGWLAGVPAGGVWLGVTLTLLARERPVELRLHPKDWTSAAVAIPFALAPRHEAWVWGMGLLAALALAWAGGWAVEGVQRLALARRRRWAAELPGLRLDRLERGHAGFLLLHVLRGACAALAGAWLVSRLVPAADALLDEAGRQALAAAWRLAPVVALPLWLRGFRRGVSPRWLAGGVLIGALVLAATGGGGVG